MSGPRNSWQPWRAPLGAAVARGRCGRASAVAVVAAVVLFAGCRGCDRGRPGPAAAAAGPVAPPEDAAVRPLTVEVVGMDDPFARLTGDLPAKLGAARKALRARSYPEARTALAAVVALCPDYSPARFDLVRADALAGDFAAATSDYAALLARDHVVYAHRLDSARDLAPLRASPEWPRIAEWEMATLAAYAAGLDRGFFFVARTRDVRPPTLDGVTPLGLDQEAYFFDSAARRYRRMTRSGGQVYAINVSPDRRRLAFVLVDKIIAKGGEGSLVAPRAGFVDLTTLTTVGPFAMDPSEPLVQIGFSTTGEPRFRCADHEFIVDTARAGLARSDIGAEEFGGGGVTYADYDSVSHFDFDRGGATLSPDGLTLTVPGAPTPIRSARPLDAATLSFSPAHRYLAYAGVLDACKVIDLSRASGLRRLEERDANDLYLWDGQQKVASRIARAVSGFDSLWLDEDHLVYEGGVGREGKIHVYQVSTRSDTALRSRHGAGLYGYPTLTCDAPPDDDLSPDPPPEDNE